VTGRDVRAELHRVSEAESVGFSDVCAGGLMSFGPNFPDLFPNAATFCCEDPQGPKPSELPVEQRSTFELVINLKTAEALGLTIPPSATWPEAAAVRAQAGRPLASPLTQRER
jgi:hypothetical protein